MLGGAESRKTPATVDNWFETRSSTASLSSALRWACPRPRQDWLKLAHKLEHALAGQGELLHGDVLPRDPELDGLVENIRGHRRRPARPPAAPEQAPASAAADVGIIAVDPRRVTTEQREAGPVHVGYQFWNRLGLGDILRDVGIPSSTRQLACAMILTRLIQPAAEHAMPDWLRRTALADILGTDFAALAEDPLYRVLDKLHPHRAAIEAALTECHGWTEKALAAPAYPQFLGVLARPVFYSSRVQALDKF